MIKFSYEEILYAQEYYDEKSAGVVGHGEEVLNAFQSCEEDLDRVFDVVKKTLLDVLGEEDGEKISIEGLHYYDRDSSNISHAGCFFQMYLVGEENLLRKFAVEYYGHSEEEFQESVVRE